MPRQWIVARTDATMTQIRKRIDRMDLGVICFQPIVKRPDGINWDYPWLDYILVAGDESAVKQLPVRIMPIQDKSLNAVVMLWQGRIEEMQESIRERRDARTWAARHRGARARIVGGVFHGSEGTVGELSGQKTVYLDGILGHGRLSVKVTELELID